MATTGHPVAQALIYRLDDGLLVGIFEELTDETGKDLSPVLHLIMVCKQWSVLALPLLFRHLSLHIDGSNSSRRRLHGFARHARLQSMNGETACSRLRSIGITLKTELAPEDVSDMAYIICNASNLQFLGARGRGMPGLLSMAAQSVSSTLQSLKLVVGNNIIFDVQHIGQLKHLRSLTISSYANWSEAYEFWDMPCLELLDWQGFPDDHLTTRCCSGDVAFLNRCRFIGLKELKILLSWNNEPPPSQSTELARLLAMTTTPNGRLESASLFLMRSQTSAVLPCVPVPTLDLVDSPLSPDIARHLHPRVISLAITTVDSNVNGLWQFLDALHMQVRSRRPGCNLRYIKIFSLLPYLPGFTWGFQGDDMLALSDDATSFVGRLLGFAVRLKVYGIHIMDEKGDGFDGASRKVVLS